MEAFPTSKYARYKRATSFFLDWVLAARGSGRDSGQKVKLAAIDADSGHRHFMTLLRGWQKTLQEVVTTSDQGEEEDIPQSTKFNNYYDVLELDEVFFPDEEAFDLEIGAPRSVKDDRERLFNEAFAEDLRLEVIYFFLELEELVEGVFSIYDQVKKQQRTMMEATVVAKLAMDTATALTARLQLRYPALKTAEDVANIVMGNAPKNYLKKMSKTVTDFWTKFQNNGTYTFVPGMLIMDFISVGSTLASFTSAIPTQPRMQLVLRDGFFGETYGEERTPQYVLPDPTNMVVFLLQQLPQLYNTILATKVATGKSYDDSVLAGSFMALMDQYFKSRQVTVPIVFTCICWLKSVAALQGKSGLTRNVSLTFKYSKDLMKNMEATIAKGAVRVADREIHEGLKKCAEEIKLSSRGHNLARANPLMAGFMMLTHHFHYLHMASENLMVTSRFRAFGHLYNALVEQQFLPHIPFFDEVLEIYDEMIFTPSRGAAAHGSYTRTYLLSSHLTATAVNAMYRGVAPPARKEGVKVRRALYFQDLSKIYRLLTQNDKTVLGGASSKAMLKIAADICSKELFQTRVLSRDILKLNDDLTDVFSDMCDELGQRQFHDEYIAHPNRGESQQYRVNRALEDAVMLALLPLLHCLQPDGSLDLSRLPSVNRAVEPGPLGGEAVKAMCRKAAAAIKAKFASPPLVCERKYFTFPSKPDFVNQEYGAPSSRRPTEGEARNNLFNNLTTLMENSATSLSGSELKFLKSELRRDPDLIAMGLHYSLPETSRGTIDMESTSNEKLYQLSSLFHQAAAGPAHDADLVEWMIQLGALTIQPLHCRRLPRMRDLPFTLGVLPNTMAVHSAALAGHEDIVRIILEADNMIDLNTPTLHTKETLAHLAVKHGHRKLYDMLAAFGADLRIKDGRGKRVCDVTTDREWKRKIVASIVEIEKSQAVCEGAKNRDALFRHQSDIRAERLRQSVAAQRDQERQRAVENANSNTTKSSKKKKSKKKAKGTSFSLTGPVAAAEDNSVEVTNFLTDLLAATGLNTAAATDNAERAAQAAQLENSVENTAAMFARLRDPAIPAEDKADDALRACRLVEKLEGSVGAFAHSSRLNSTDRRIRIAISLKRCKSFT